MARVVAAFTNLFSYPKLHETKLPRNTLETSLFLSFCYSPPVTWSLTGYFRNLWRECFAWAKWQRLQKFCWLSVVICWYTWPYRIPDKPSVWSSSLYSKSEDVLDSVDLQFRQYEVMFILLWAVLVKSLSKVVGNNRSLIGGWKPVGR